jgi:hypothetical protein
MNAKSRLDELVKKHLQPLLKSRGFHRKSRTWNRREADFTQVIHIQASRWNQADSGSFTINLGIFVESLYRVFAGEDPNQFIRDTECILRKRIGYVSNGAPRQKTDRWWRFDGNTDLAGLGKEINESLESYAIPFLDRNSSLRAIEAFLSSDISWEARTPTARIYLAIIKHRLNDRHAARELLKEVASHRQPVWQERAHVVASRLRIELHLKD